MANSTILSLPAAVSADGTEYFWGVQGGTDKRFTGTQIANTATGFVPTSRSITAGVGLSGGGSLASDVTLNFYPAELSDATTMAVTDSFVINSGSTPKIVTFPLSMQAIGGLTVSPALNLASDKLMVLRAADGLVYYTTPSAIGTAAGNVPAGGSTGQFLAKVSGTDYDTAWGNTATSFVPTSSTVPTNGMYLPAANTLGWAINSSAELQLTASALSPAVSGGNSLGTTSLMWANLFLANGGVINWNNGNVTLNHAAGGLATSGYLRVGSASAPSNTSAGDLTTARAFIGDFTAIDLGGSSIPSFQMAGTADLTSSPLFARFANDANSPIIRLLKSRGASVGTNTIVSSGDTLGVLSFFGADGASYLQGASIRAIVDGTPGVNDMPTLLAFYTTADGASVVTGRWIIDSDGAFKPFTDDGAALGTTALKISDAFFASGAVINFNNGNYTLTHSAGNLTAAGGPFTAPSFIPSGSTVPTNGFYLPAANTLGWAINSAAEMQLTASALSPAVSDGNALGTTSLMWSDLFLASGAVINFNNSNYTVTHSSGLLTFSGSLTSSGNLTSSNAFPAFVIYNTSGGVDKKYWNIFSDYTTDTLSMFASNDAGSAVSTFLRVTRSTYLISAVDFPTGIVSASDTTPATSTTSAAFRIAGGLGVALGAYVGGDVRFTSSTVSSSASTGALVVTGGLGVGGAMFLTGALTCAAAGTFTTSISIDRNGGQATINVNRMDTHGSAATVSMLRAAGRDSGGNSTVMTELYTYCTDATDTSEDAEFRFSTIVAGTLAPRLHLGAGLYTPSASGGDKGAGSINIDGAFWCGSSIQTTAPVTKTADFTVAATENYLINNKSGSACTVTLPTASSFTGRAIFLKTIQAQAINSASSNVVPKAGGAAGTAIVTGTAGNWALIVSNGTNWEIMAGT